MAKRIEGNVEWYDKTKGYGMITIPTNVVLHYPEILDGWENEDLGGYRVEFELVNTEQGFMAKQVKVLYKNQK